MPNTFADRRQALEDSFFKDLEARKLSHLREELSGKTKREELSKVCGIEDSAVLNALTKLGVGAHDVSALSLVPLIQMAWTSGTINKAERAAVLKAAAAQGITEECHSYTLLEAWLAREPKQELFDSWTGYVKALRSHLEDSEMTALKESILGLAHDVADAAGGFLGVGSVSSVEKDTLTAIGDAFDG